MDLQELKTILNYEVPDNVKERLIIVSLSKDDSVITNILGMLNAERDAKKALVRDMNLELSRAHIYVEGVTESKRQKKSSFNKKFLLEEISKFYFKYKNEVSHCFNRFT